MDKSLVGLLVVGALAGSAQAAILDVTAVVGGRSAEAKFEVSGATLVVTITNTSTADANVPMDMLTAIFFDVSGATLNLSKISGLLAPGSIAVNVGSQPAGGIIGGEWAYLETLVGAPHSAKYGISSSGLGLFGPGDRFPGADLDPPPSPDGVNYGLTSAGDDPTNNNGGASVPLIKNSAVFTLGNLPAGFDPMARISNVSFQYGTGLDEPNIPAPAGAAVMGLAVLATARRRR